MRESGYLVRVFNMIIDPTRWTHVYVTCVIVHVTFCVVTVTRVCGMIFQYSSSDISRECLTVSEGYLMQTPFNKGCLNIFDHVILVCMGLILAMFILIIFFIILNQFKKDASEYLCNKIENTCKWISSKFSCFKLNDLTFNINGEVTVSSRQVRNDTLDYISYRRVENHFEDESTV